MGFSSYLKQIYLDRDQVVSRPGELYAIGTHPVFEIVGGLVALTLLIGRHTEDQVGAAEIGFEIDGVALDGTSLTIAAHDAGDVFVSLLDGSTAIVANDEIVDFFTPVVIPVAGPGTIDFVVGAAQVEGVEFYVAYKALHPAAAIVLA